MSEQSLSLRDHLILGTASMMLLLLACLSLAFRESPVVGHGPIAIPLQIRAWQGHDIPHTVGELGVLGNVSLVWREYHDTQEHVLWLIAQQTPSMGKLHNVYVSLVASGAQPAITRHKAIPTQNGPLAVSILQLQGVHGGTRTGYLWYQWTDRFGHRHSAPDRWAWYAGVLQCRLQQDIPQWRLVEIVTPQDASAEQRLDAFAKTLYELP